MARSAAGIIQREGRQASESVLQWRGCDCRGVRFAEMFTFGGSSSGRLLMVMVRWWAPVVLTTPRTGL